MGNIKNILEKMLFRFNLWGNVDNRKHQRFFATDSELQREYIYLCDLCSTMSNIYYEMASNKGLDNPDVIKYKKELDKKRSELDEFKARWDVKF